jgi:AcrR family transcriptional regulator
MDTTRVSRRERLHLATVEEVKAVARVLMAREGTSSLNLRAIAREMGMTASALYRYFPSRDAILTALIIDAYDDVGAAVEQAVAQAPVDATATAILAAVHRFRRWALDHPQEYGLTYGTPVPGYEAPEEQTTAPAMRTNFALLGLLARALEQGVVRLPADSEIPEPILAVLRAMAEQTRQVALPLAALAAACQFWIVLYGAISAEVFGHLPRSLAPQAGALFDRTMRAALASMGVDHAAIDAGISPDP